MQRFTVLFQLSIMKATTTTAVFLILGLAIGTNSITTYSDEVEIESRIAGGVTSTFAYAVQVNTPCLSCSGLLKNKKWVITAAQCVK